MPAPDGRPTYPDAVETYRGRDWTDVLPLRAGTKWPPPTGHTGAGGHTPTDDEIAAWCRTYPDGNLAVRVPPDVVGIDIDAYGGKPGADTLADLEATHGPLPPTWTSTSRTDGTSGIRCYRIPHGTRLTGIAGPGIEIIQHHHRYVVAWPSIHPDGDPYRWISPEGEPVDEPPHIDELAALPWTWIDALTVDNAEPDITYDTSNVTRGRSGPWSPAVARAHRQATERIAEGHSRHDATTAAVMALVRLDTLGHPGARDAIGDLRSAFTAAVTGDGTRDGDEAAAEWDRMVTGAEDKVAATPSTVPPWNDGDPGDLIAVDGDTGWGEPRPLIDTDPWEPFPTQTLPDEMRTVVDALAEAHQVPVDLPAHVALGALSTIVTATKTHLQLRPTWREGANLYVVVAMPVATGKSPVVAKLTAPVEDIAARLGRDAAKARAEAESERKILEKRVAQAETTIAATAEPDPAVVARRDEAMATLALWTRPPDGRLLADDVTPEGFTRLLAEAGGAIGIISSEGGLFDQLTRYVDSGKPPNLDAMLKAWSGDTIRVDRASGEPRKIDDPRAVIALTVQPHTIERLHADPDFLGRGLVARFMTAQPDVAIGHRDVTHQPDDTAALDDWGALIETIWARHQGSNPVTYHLGDEARELFDTWRQNIEHDRRDGNRLGEDPLREASSKTEASVARLALVFHVAERGGALEEIPASTMARAITVGDWWIGEALRLAAGTRIPREVRQAARVAEWALDQNHRDFTLRDIQRGGVTSWRAGGKVHGRTYDHIRTVLHVLAEAGWARPISSDQREWTLNPALSVDNLPIWRAKCAARVEASFLDPPSLSTTHPEQGTPRAPRASRASLEDAPQAPTIPTDAPPPSATTRGDNNPPDPFDPELF